MQNFSSICVMKYKLSLLQFARYATCTLTISFDTFDRFEKDRYLQLELY